MSDQKEEQGPVAEEARSSSCSSSCKGPKTVLLGVDGSGVSNRAVEWYFEELYQKGDVVIFMHSFELPLMHSYQEMYVAPEMWQASLKHEADKTAHMEKAFMKKLKIKEIKGKFMAKGGGKPGEAILNVAEEEDVDLIVMGTRGHGQLMRALLGSVSHYVMSHAHCPVMIYRDKKSKKEGKGKKEKNSKDAKEAEAAKEPKEEKEA